MIWVCEDCSPRCMLKGGADSDDPPRGCPWAHNNLDDPNECNWRIFKEDE